MNIGGVGLVTGEYAVAIKSQMVGVGTDETHRVGRAGQVLDPPLLQRGEIGRADPQFLANGVEIEFELLTPGPQQLADRARAPRRRLFVHLFALDEGALYALEKAHGALSIMRHCKAAAPWLSNRTRLAGPAGVGKRCGLMVLPPN